MNFHPASMSFNAISVLDIPAVRISTTLVFIDLAVPDALTLIAGVAPQTAVYLFNAVDNPITQITQALSQHYPVSSLHIVAHGQAGGLELGGQWLSLETLPDYTRQLQSWSTALTGDAEILLYGCHVGRGDRGRRFVQQFSQLTGAAVAASEGLIGNAALGGTWNLGVQTDRVTSELAFRPEVMQDYTGVLAIADPKFSS
jgi:hypothetical protein